MNHSHKSLFQSHIRFHGHSCTRFSFSVPYSPKSLNRGRSAGCDIFYGLAVVVAFGEFFAKLGSDDIFNQYPLGIWKTAHLKLFFPLMVASFSRALNHTACFISFHPFSHMLFSFTVLEKQIRSETVFKTGVSPTLIHWLQILFPPTPQPQPDLPSLIVSPPHLSLLCSG